MSDKPKFSGTFDLKGNRIESVEQWIMDRVQPDERMIAADKLYTRDQAARYFQVTKRTMQRWEAEKIGPKVTRIGLAVYYKGSSILAALEEGTPE